MARIATRLRLAAGFVGGWLLQNLGRLLFWIVASGLLFCLIVGGIAYYLVREETTTCQTTAGVMVLIGSAIVGVISGGAFTAAKTLAGWVDGINLGPMVSKAIFAQTLGVTDKRPEGKTALAKSLQGASVGTVKETLGTAFGEIFATRALDRWLPAPGRWLASKIVNTAGRLATQQVISRLPGKPDDNAAINLVDLRNQIGEQIDGTAAGFVTFRAKLVAVAAMLLGAIVVLLLVFSLTAAM